MAEVDVENGQEKELELENQIRTKLESEYATRLQEEILSISKKMTEENKTIVSEAIERFRKEMTPPTEQDIQKLVTQEYIEYNIPVKYQQKGGERKLVEKTFTIREVPHIVEKKMYRKLKDTLVPLASEFSSFTMNLLEGDAAKKIVQIMNTFDPMLDVMISICTMCLNPFGEDTEVTEDWVKENLSSSRIVKIITAQVECNKMRDFFSLLFQGSKLLK